MDPCHRDPMLEMERLPREASPPSLLILPCDDDRDSLKLKFLKSFVELVEKVFWWELDELEKELDMLEDITREEKLLLVLILVEQPPPLGCSREFHPP